MKMFATCAIVLFCWASASHSTPNPCENLRRPVDSLNFNDVKGRWALVAVSAADPKYLEKLKSGDSGSGSFANYTDSTAISFTRVSKADDSCQYMQTNVTLDGSGFIDPHFNITMTLLQSSCPDCLVLSLNKSPDQPLRLYLFSRRREVEQREMEEFKAQAECLSMSEHHVMDPTKELCPEQITRNAAAPAGASQA